MISAQTILLAVARVAYVAYVACAALYFLAVNTWAANDLPVFVAGNAGDQVCTRCHDASEKKPILSVYRTRHGVAAQPGCQACHGSSRAHVLHEGPPAERPPVEYGYSGTNQSRAEVQTRICLTCHAAGKRSHWPGSAHASSDVTCAACHQIHQPDDKVLNKATQREVCFTCHQAQRAQTHYLSTHPIAAGRIACSSCHNPHGSTGPKLLIKNTVNESCYECHADKRGPFLWEHPPASDDCTNCHTPHGSNIAPLLKVRAPWLCQGCHAGSLHTTPAFSGRALPPAGNGNAPSPQLLLRACLNCHSAIHGSNHPSGARFTR